MLCATDISIAPGRVTILSVFGGGMQLFKGLPDLRIIIIPADIWIILDLSLKG